MKNSSALYLTATLLIVGGLLPARENTNQLSANQQSELRAGCAPPTSVIDLDINNVRAKILNGGDMWGNLGSAGYEVPVGSGNHSLYAGSLWIGGIDLGGQIKIAAQTYRQTGNDYYPGPLDASSATDPSTCLAYDRHWKLNKADVLAYHNWVLGGFIGPNPVSSTTMNTINNWPVTDQMGSPLAPFFDYDSDGLYNPVQGDYPDFNLSSSPNCASRLNGDQNIWWVFNDNGNAHTETGGASIGLEVHAQAFAFSTNSPLNNVTFYKYKIINTSSFFLNNTYFGQWVDADLGGYTDDYVGCDVERGLGFCYNGDASDSEYGTNPPAVGLDFLEGPFADANGSDDAASDVPESYGNYGDAVIDNERLGMSKFVYYNNNNTNYGNPTAAVHFYNYLKGQWKNGTPISYGGTGQAAGTPCDYMFPGTSDPVGFGVGGTPSSPMSQPAWTEASVGNTPGDRRFLQSAGPFTLMPGAINSITTAVVWARATSGGPLASVNELKNTDDAAQMLFNNCFTLITDAKENTSRNLNVKIYPNPFYESAIISFEKEREDNYHLSIYDLQGRLVHEIPNIGNTTQVIRNQMGAGTYIYSIRDSRNNISTGKFIIK
ncbi:MAG TPA: T9SS type A sorting domain-containing protein [Bacteroidia bacterium]|jgi:hypothetical protein